MFDPASRMGSVEVPGTKLMRAEKQPLDRMALSWCLGGFDKSMVNLWLIYGLLHGFASQETKVQVQLKLLWRMFRTFKVCITLQSRASSWSLTDEVTAKSDSQTP